MRPAERRTLERRGAVGRLERGVARLAQHVDHQHPHQRLVVDHEDRLARAAAGAARPRAGGAGLGSAAPQWRGR